MASFFFNIQKRVESGLVASGKFDGSHACLAVATSGGNVFIHNPHKPPIVKDPTHEQSDGRLTWSGELAELQIGSQVTALCTGQLGEDERHVLLVGTATHVLAYHVEDNTDLFYKEMMDGAHCIIIGKLGWLQSQVAIVGGTCSVTVLDSQGGEIFWTVSTNAAISLSPFDFDGDGENELLIGTENFEIKVQKEDFVLWQVQEAAAIVALTGLNGKRRFAYGTADGTIGVYENSQKLWRAKSKHKVASMKAYDLNGDKTSELITGWSNGRVDARTASTGEIIFKIQLSTAIAGIVEADYRRTGRSDLIVVSASGEVRGYCPNSAITGAPEAGEVMRKLLARRQALQAEFGQRKNAISDYYLGPKLAVGITSGNGAARLDLAAGPGHLIHGAIVFAGGIFEGKTFVAHPSEPRGELEIKLRPARNEPADVNIKAFIGPPGSDLYQVFEIVQQLPRFCMYEVVPEPKVIPLKLTDNGATINVAERPQRVALWLNQSLIVSDEIEVQTQEGRNSAFIKLWLHGLRDNSLHLFAADASGRVNVQTEDSSFAGDVIQSLAAYLGLRELSCEAKFPRDEMEMCEALERIKGLKEIDARLQSEAAGDAVSVKNLVIRLEDARILENFADMKKRLTQVKNHSDDSMRKHEIRMKSHRELTATLKRLNIGVERAAKLRVGKAATNAVTRCRAAIVDENEKALVLAMRYG